MHRNFLDSRNIIDWMVAYCQDQSSPLYMDETGSTHKSSVHSQLYRCRHRRHNRCRLFHYHSRGQISVFHLLIIQIPKCMVLHPTRLLSFRTSRHLQPFFDIIILVRAVSSACCGCVILKITRDLGLQGARIHGLLDCRRIVYRAINCWVEWIHAFVAETLPNEYSRNWHAPGVVYVVKSDSIELGVFRYVSVSWTSSVANKVIEFTLVINLGYRFLIIALILHISSTVRAVCSSRRHPPHFKINVLCFRGILWYIKAVTRHIIGLSSNIYFPLVFSARYA